MADDSDTLVRGLFITGLQNAHAIENQALSIMNRQLERLEHYPWLSALLTRHVAETKTLEEERAMAKWLDDNIPAITTRFLELERAGIRWVRSS